MPKQRKPERRQAATLRVAATSGHGFDPSNLQRVGTLEVVQGAAADVGRQVRCDRPIVIGRDERIDLSLHDGSISRSHCSVQHDHAGNHVLVDLGSTNGTTVNGIKVIDRVALNPGDKIFLGASVVRFSLSDSVDIAYHSKLEELVSTDPLTGLNTKRQYDAFFDVYAQRAIAEESLLTVLVTDMDGLKQINDTHGHDLGSFAIAEVAAILSNGLATHGNVARFGGDEFVACFPGLDGDTVAQLAEEVRHNVQQHHFEMAGIRVAPTISVGVASFPRDVATPLDLFRSADQALYRAKGAGKNRVARAASR